MASSLGIAPEPHWWKAFVFTAHRDGTCIVAFQMMRTNLRGELTLHEKEKMQQFCLRDNKLVDAVASHFKVGSTEVHIKSSI